MSSSSSSSCSRNNKPRIYRIGTDGNVYCNHEMVAVKRVAGSRSSRQGKEFYGCPLWPNSDCKFFVWKEDVDGTNNLVEINKALQMKIANLEIDNMVLMEENKNLRKKADQNIKSRICLIAELVLGFVFWFDCSTSF
ncbi:putative transcription factor GRF family [Helianthus anomalus]